MNRQKTLLGTLAGGVAFFLLGWVVYGMLLESFMKEHYNQCMNITNMEDMKWWALIVSNLIWAFMIALIFSWSNTSGFMAGMMRGAIFGVIISLGMDLQFYSMTTMYDELSTIAINAVVNLVFTGIGGGVIGWVMGMGKPASA